ncbi:hypothetical protein RDI58_029837 [Solanum bulbocastanum]|uniref:Uncharacterized protein n=1 Tax=Solanum bulbocastanum TaxID=147425 RepID=A0AAN8Y2J1_SOLBU
MATSGTDHMIHKNIFGADFHEHYGEEVPDYTPWDGDIHIEKDSTEVATQSVHGDGVEETISKAAGEVTSSNEVDKEVVETTNLSKQKLTTRFTAFGISDCHLCFKESKNFIEFPTAGILNPVIASVEGELTEGQTETSEKEASEKISHISALKIELLGVSVVGEIISFLRGYDRKNGKNSTIEAAG